MNAAQRRTLRRIVNTALPIGATVMTPIGSKAKVTIIAGGSNLNWVHVKYMNNRNGVWHRNELKRI